MSRLSSSASKEVVQRKAEISMYEAQAEQNFMGGTSFKVNPLQTLKMVATSSIFGEPQYYRKGIKVEYPSKLSADFIFADLISPNEDAGQVFERVIDNALDYDYLGTLEFAKELRNEYLMRLNPAVIYVRAIRHKNRVEFNAKNPGYMRAFAKEITPRPDDITNQFEYYMYLNGSKKGLPSILKRSWADSLESMSRYQINKYKGKRLIDLVRLSHANNETINELMRTGTVAIKETEQTWEMLKDIVEEFARNFFKI
ncbi:MAG: virus [Bacteroidota bacterium]